MHLGQKTDDKSVPKWAPPAWEIERWKKKTPQVDRPQPTVEIDEFPPGYGQDGPKEKKDDYDRGVVIIEFK